MNNKYNVFVKRDSKGVFKKTLLLQTNFNIYVFIITLIMTILILPLYIIDVALSFLSAFIYGRIMTKILVKIYKYEYVGYTFGKNKKEAKQVFVESYKLQS